MKNGALDKVQLAAVRAITKSLKTTDRCLVEMATGTGKTRTYVKYLKEHPNLKVLVLTHMNELVSQHVTALKVGGIDPGLYTSSVRDASKRVVVSSIPTLSRPNHLKKVKRNRFDLIVVDEAHHSPAESWSRILKAFPKAKRLGLTATPFRPDGKQITEIFGGISYSVPFKEAQQKKLIAKHSAKVILTDSVFTGGAAASGDYSKGALDRLFASKDRDEVIVKSYNRYGRGGMRTEGLKFKTVCFCINTAHAKRLADKFNAAGIKANYLVGNTKVQSAAQRADIFDKFSKGHAIEVLCVVGIFNEGVDIPDIGCALMVRPTRSNIVYQQQIGRAARRLKGVKDTFVLLDYVDNVRADFASYTSSNVTATSPLASDIITEYLTDPDPVVVEKRVKDVMAGVERFEAAWRVPNGYWTYETILKNARKYSSIKEWRILGSAAYSASHELGLRIRVYKAMGWKSKRSVQVWTKETVLREAKKYKTRTQFQEACGGAHKKAVRMGWLKEAYSHMDPPPTKWTLEACQVEALKYETRTEMGRHSTGAYQAALRNNWLEIITSHMRAVVKEHTLDSCRKQARRYSRRIDWANGDSGSYKAATRRGWVDQCCAHMAAPRGSAKGPKKSKK